MPQSNYVEWQRMCNSLFYGVGLTPEHITSATRRLLAYALSTSDGRQVLSRLGVGVEYRTDGKNKTAIVRFVRGDKDSPVEDGSPKFRELTIREIENIGFSLRGGPAWEPADDNTPLISRNHNKLFEDFVEIAKEVHEIRETGAPKCDYVVRLRPEEL